MGPRLHSRGRRLSNSARISAHAASMGPRLHSRGRAEAVRIVARMTSLLQWGRGFTAADGPPNPTADNIATWAGDCERVAEKGMQQEAPIRSSVHPQPTQQVGPASDSATSAISHPLAGSAGHVKERGSGGQPQPVRQQRPGNPSSRAFCRRTRCTRPPVHPSDPGRPA